MWLKKADLQNAEVLISYVISCLLLATHQSWLSIHGARNCRSSMGKLSLYKWYSCSRYRVSNCCNWFHWAMLTCRTEREKELRNHLKQDRQKKRVRSACQDFFFFSSLFLPHKQLKTEANSKSESTSTAVENRHK